MKHYFTYFKFPVLILLFISLVSTFQLYAQGLTLNRIPFLEASPEFVSPAIELGLLPDTPSYIIIEELYNADTLTHKGLALAFYNYGSTRVSIEPYRDSDYSKSQITTLQFVGDTFCIQVTEHFENHSILKDSVQVWWQDGLIRRAIINQRHRGRTEINYTYQSGKLIHTKTQGTYGNSETIYSYKDQKLNKVTYNGSHFKSTYEFHYTDSLVTITSTTPEKGWLIKKILQYDKMGRLSSKKIYQQGKNDTELRLYQVEETINYGNNGFRRTYTQRLGTEDHVSILEFNPRHSPEERWTWVGSDQVWLRFREQL